MTQEGNGHQYQFREQPPTPAVVEALILELFQGKLTERKVIADEVLRVHLSRGGAKPRAQFESSFRRALLTMKDAGLAENPSQGYWHIYFRDGQPVPAQAPIAQSVEEADCDITAILEMPTSPQVEAVADTVLGQGSGAIYLYYLPAYRLRAEEHGEKTWPCKIGRTDHDPLTRVLSQAGTALPERPHLALVIRTDHPGAWEAALHGVLTLRGLRIDDLPGSEWFLTSPAEVLALVHVFNPQFAEPKAALPKEENSS
jgi:hypothetical protein